ncbi:MAG: hypothetical protein QOF18_182 [Frankiaceae bacterium]|nr:hypothetical protein [Frankiaceae bacterium]
MTWRSPVTALRRGKTFFASGIELTHQGAKDTGVSYRMSARPCLAHGPCEPWTTVISDRNLQYAEPGVLPFFVSTGTGINFGWLGSPRRGYVEWRLTQNQRTLDWAESVVRVAVGPAAAAMAARG